MSFKGSSPEPSSGGFSVGPTLTSGGDGTQLQAGAQPFRPPPPFSLATDSTHRYDPPSFGAAKRPGGASPPPPHPFTPGVPSYGSGQKSANRPVNSSHMSSLSNPPVQGKFKTEMCRNWELMGQCTYRGCTYAHGPEDLRQPISYDAFGRIAPSTVNRYPGQQAPMYQGDGQSSNNNTPMGGARQSSLSRTAPQPISASAPAVASEQIIDMILVEVRHERDDLLQQVNASKQLEADLRREQRRRQAVVRTQRALEGVLLTLKQEINERTRCLNEILKAKGDYDFEAVLDDVMDSEEEAREHHGIDSEEDDCAAYREDTHEFRDAKPVASYEAQHKYASKTSVNVWGTGMGTAATSSNTLVEFDLQALDDLIEGGSTASGSSTSFNKPTGRGGQQGRGGRGSSHPQTTNKNTTQPKPSAWGESRGGRGGSGRGSGRGSAAKQRR